ncbi:MAG TPA: SRPBCC family protein [Actinomycetales bacterium]|nr:SRPBCC family protein [Actinomycetales bacterium]
MTTAPDVVTTTGPGTARAEVTVAAPPSVVWAALADPTRMGRWSPEAVRARPHGATTGPLGVGAVFTGSNRSPRARWSTRCEVTESTPGQSFAFAVSAVGGSPVSRWRFDLTPDRGGTRVVQTWHDARAGLRGSVIKAFGSLVLPGDRAEHNASTMTTTLRAMAEDLGG